jgi:hypothetical protein
VAKTAASLMGIVWGLLARQHGFDSHTIHQSLRIVTANPKLTGCLATKPILIYSFWCYNTDIETKELKMTTITIKYLTGPKQYSKMETREVRSDLVGFLYEVGATFNEEDGDTYIVVEI